MDILRDVTKRASDSAMRTRPSPPSVLPLTPTSNNVDVSDFFSQAPFMDIAPVIDASGNPYANPAGDDSE